MQLYTLVIITVATLLIIIINQIILSLLFNSKVKYYQHLLLSNLSDSIKSISRLKLTYYIIIKRTIEFIVLVVILSLIRIIIRTYDLTPFGIHWIIWFILLLIIWGAMFEWVKTIKKLDF